MLCEDRSNLLALQDLLRTGLIQLQGYGRVDLAAK
jgi:hypothetical protein